jgi:hypothetical protein
MPNLGNGIHVRLPEKKAVDLFMGVKATAEMPQRISKLHKAEPSK